MKLLRKKQEDVSEFEMLRRCAWQITNAEHRKIVEMIDEHDARRAEQMMKNHIENLIKRVEDAS